MIQRKKGRPAGSTKPIVQKLPLEGGEAAIPPSAELELDSLRRRAYAGVRPVEAKALAVSPLENKGLSKPPPRPARTSLAPAPSLPPAGRARIVVSEDEGHVLGLREGASRQDARKLRAAGPPAKKIDLHGLRAQQAREALRRLLPECQARGLLSVCIVYGKGLHSADGMSVLRQEVLSLLSEEELAALVHCFVSAPERFGGSGALWLRLRRRL